MQDLAWEIAQEIQHGAVAANETSAPASQSLLKIFFHFLRVQ